MDWKQLEIPFEEFKKEDDKVNHPSHYTWLKEKAWIEVIDITRHLSFNIGNAIKYILRAGHKEEEWMSSMEKHREDIKKAIRYLEDELAHNLLDK